MLFLEANVQRIQEDLEAMARYTSTPGQGVTRFSFSNEDRLTRAYIKERMQQCGLTVYEDVAGAIVGRRPGKKDQAPVVMVGSHFDSVKNGGSFDGPAGVVAALEIARVLEENKVITEHPIEFVALVEEEGGRFGGGLFGSRAMAGKVSREELTTFKDEYGITIAQAMTKFGFDPDLIGSAARDPRQLRAFFELHIEQGPVLETSGVAVGIVEIVVGITQLEITLQGRADHAGTTPMEMRADALVAAADLIMKVGRLARNAGNGTVATVGKISALPGAANIVPGNIECTVDIRSKKLENINFVVRGIERELNLLIRHNPAISYSIMRKLSVSPVRLAPQVIDILTAEGNARGISTKLMQSGAGHDAMVMAGLTEVGLIFVPSKGGRSHCPEEWTDYAQLKQGVDVLLGAVLTVAKKIT